MRRVLVVGIGAGDPEHLTVQAVRALNAADVFFVMDKGDDKDDLAALRREICDRYVEDRSYRVVETPDPPRDLRGPSYAAGVRSWHDTRADIYERLLRDELADGQAGAFLVWGDPALYDSTLRILDQVAARGAVAFAVEVVPGISSVQALAAAHRVALHGIGRPVHVTTGRRLADEGWPAGVDDVVVMLDGRCAFATVEPAGVTIFWGAYLGTPDQILLSGPLADVAGEIERVRAEARGRKGWMFDTYLLRRDGGD
ncbi:MAG TPA: precorrin-6A synthase (deacetylating) [Acidimicrobiales bacterium]|nr:precorrin-6A synthase (deacetylating) [Acidimicrobiales bacterium]